MNGSAPWRITLQEFFVWVKKQTPYFAGYAVVFLGALQQGKSLQEASQILYMYLMNVAISFLTTVSRDTRG